MGVMTIQIDHKSVEVSVTVYDYINSLRNKISVNSSNHVRVRNNNAKLKLENKELKNRIKKLTKL